MIDSNINEYLLDAERLETTLAQVQRLISIGSLSAGVAHELINPLSIITATVNTLLNLTASDQLDSDELLHYLEIIDRCAWRCVRLAESLRNYSYQGQTKMAPNDLNQIIENALSLVQYQFVRNDNVIIDTSLQPDMAPVHCDDVSITQVLVNLLLNARDALPDEGGIIRIKSWSDESNGDQLISVSDTGSGIAPDILDKVFEPFFTTKPVGQGTGLGLAIAADIIKQHHGQITADNNPDEGAIFTVCLPSRQPE